MFILLWIMFNIWRVYGSIADGWYNAPKYINYIPANFTDTHGTIWSGITTW